MGATNPRRDPDYTARYRRAVNPTTQRFKDLYSREWRRFLTAPKAEVGLPPVARTPAYER